MSQPWRPSRGSGKSRWSSEQPTLSSNRVPARDTRQSSNKTADAPYGSQRPPFVEPVFKDGMRAANLRPVRDNVMDLSSPSRGELATGKSLTNPTVQAEFRQHLEVKVKKYQSTFPDELGIILANNAAQKEQLDLILLDFRKLREGIISSGRKDGFATEVYETSAKLAILARNTPQIATILPHLVRTLHWPKPPEAGQQSIEDRLGAMHVAYKPAESEDTRARFVSYYLLHTFWIMQDRPAFQNLLADLVDFDLSSDESQRIPHTSTHIRFVLEIFRIHLSGNYARLAKILQRPYGYDKFAWLLVRSALQQSRTTAWHAVRASYQALVDRKWLWQNLLLESEQALQAFLQEEKWTDHVKSDGTILLKKAK